MERELGLPVTTYLESTDDASLAKLNLDFIDFVVSPLWRALR